MPPPRLARGRGDALQLVAAMIQQEHVGAGLGGNRRGQDRRAVGIAAKADEPPPQELPAGGVEREDGPGGLGEDDVSGGVARGGLRLPLGQGDTGDRLGRQFVGDGRPGFGHPFHGRLVDRGDRRRFRRGGLAAEDHRRREFDPAEPLQRPVLPRHELVDERQCFLRLAGQCGIGRLAGLLGRPLGGIRQERRQQFAAFRRERRFGGDLGERFAHAAERQRSFVLAFERQPHLGQSPPHAGAAGRRPPRENAAGTRRTARSPPRSGRPDSRPPPGPAVPRSSAA